jgi:hypothetical protein
MGTPVYPAAKKTYADKEDFVDVYEAAHINSLQDEVQAIQEELGTDPAGSLTDVKTRLAVCLSDDGSIQNGTGFPGSPVTGQAFFRTDEDRLYVYNSTWISVEQLSNLAFMITTSSALDANSLGDGMGTQPGSATSVYSNAHPGSVNNYVYCTDNISSYVTVARTYYKHISSITTVRCYCLGFCPNATGTAQFNIGGQTNTLNLPTAATGTTWAYCDVDVSGSLLTGDTYYEVLCQLKAATGANADTAQATSFLGIAIA